MDSYHQELNDITVILTQLGRQVNEINQNQDLINSIIEMKEIQQSGDIKLNEIMQNQEKINNSCVLIGIIGALFIIYYFIMRCLK